eukprot:5612431-Amphidinium_carterae.3
MDRRGQPQGATSDPLSLLSHQDTRQRVANLSFAHRQAQQVNLSFPRERGLCARVLGLRPVVNRPTSLPPREVLQ